MGSSEPFSFRDAATFTADEVLAMLAELDEAERQLQDVPDSVFRLGAAFALDAVARALMSRLVGDDDLWPFDRE